MNKEQQAKIILNYICLPLLGLVVIVMAWSFVSNTFFNDNADSELDADGFTKNEVIQISVLNACGTAGLADKYGKYMRLRGFDVVELGNNKNKSNHSYIVDHLGDKLSALKVALALGIPDSLIVTQIDSSLFLRASVIIGNDYKKLPDVSFISSIAEK